MFARILKYNPYHDGHGYFSDTEGAKSHSGTAAVPNLTRGKAMPHRALLRAASHPASLAHLEQAHAKVMTLDDHHAQIDKELATLLGRGVIVTQTTMATLSDAAMWHSLSPNVKPQELVDAVLGKGGVIWKAKIGLWNDSIQVDATNSEVHGAMARGISRSFYVHNGTVSHAFLSLDPKTKGGGAVKKMFAASIPVYQKMGMKKVSVHANLEGGGYAWGKYGFNANKPGEYYEEAQRGLLHAGSELRQYSRKEGITQSDGVKAEFSMLGKVLEEHKLNKELPRLLTSIKTPHLTDALHTMWPEMRKETSFINHAMTGTDWYGHLDLADEGQLSHLSAYVGSKLTKHA